ncbi:TrkH family potassium uptake protein [Floccifex sp.]|uniref:TrkH family potassium uptake protein n=1 Tax=Floccifex sp. TaxID=2815810 RepID=UPI003F0360EA
MYWTNKIKQLNWSIILRIIGFVLIVEAILLVFPLFINFLYHDFQTMAYVLPILICLGTGIPLSKIQSKKGFIFARDGLFAVGLSWIVMSILGALPFVLSKDIPNYINALFETISGFTTTGSSILTDIESLSHANLFWRSFTHWIGGMGVLVFVLAIIPGSNDRTMHIMRAEAPGPTIGKLVPRMKQSAMILYKIYVFLTIVLILLLWIGGMPLFDSFCHAFGTAGTGGFSIKNSGIGGYNSVYIDVVITVFMLLFGINFNMYYFLLMKQFKQVFKNEEFKTYIGIVITCILMIAINIHSLYPNFLEALRYAGFQVATIITTTGYATCDFNIWPMFSKIILWLLMILGACAGSTGGGLKVSRFLIIIKKLKLDIQRLIHPQKVDAISMDGKIVNDELVHQITSYFCCFMFFTFICILIVSFDNFDFETTVTSVFACVGNIGPGFGICGPMGNFSSFSYLSKIVLSIAMLVGRLEIYPIIIFIVPFLKPVKLKKRM